MLSILFLIISGLVLLILFLVLFAPVKYTSSGYKLADKLDVSALITYLNPLVRVKIHYPDELIVQVKILSFTVYPMKSRSKKATHSEQEAKPGVKDSKPSAEKEKIKISYYISLFQENKGLILEVLHIILNALKTVLPRKCRVRAVFGTGQADTTGFIYAAYCSLCEYLPGEIIFEPVWIESKAEGEYSVKGKIRLINFLSAVIKIIANKKVRLLYKKLRRV